MDAVVADRTGLMKKKKDGPSRALLRAADFGRGDEVIYASPLDHHSRKVLNILGLFQVCQISETSIILQHYRTTPWKLAYTFLKSTKIQTYIN